MRLSDAFDDGAALYDAAKEQGLEGIVAKKASSVYEPGKRSRNWLKVKTTLRQEFVVVGYTKGKGRRASGFGSLVVAVQRGSDLVWVGNVGTGFSEDELARLLAKLRPLERKTPPINPVPKMPRVRKDEVVWVTPKLVAEVEFAEWTHDGHLRAPRYLGLRDDKPPAEVRRELPLETEIRKGRRTFEALEPGQGLLPGRRRSRRATFSPTTARSRPRSSPT